ncbi:hypothetical protein HSX11_25775 [Oxalobacteraceae bacterium]|nr:hypothetical protein [Oxalobacteraceae bacterium]
MLPRIALPSFSTVLVLLACVLIACCADKPPPLLPPSNEIELEMLVAHPLPDAVFDLEYAFGHGFARVDLNGNTYRWTSRGIVFRSTQQQPLPIYRVVLDQRLSDRYPETLRNIVSKGHLRLYDRATGTKLATFSLPDSGWPGDQAGAWLAKLLNPDPSANRNQQLDIGKAAQVDLLVPSSVLQPDENTWTTPKIVGCPSNVINAPGISKFGRGELRTPNWNLIAPVGLLEVHCSQRGVFLILTHMEYLEVVTIDQAGLVIARGGVRNDKINLGLRYHPTKIVSFADLGDRVVLRQAHFDPQFRNHEPQLATYEVKFDIPWSAIRLPRPMN